MAKDKNVVFRRIHGRVIPIKVDRDQTQAKKTSAGAAIAGAGVATAAAAGRKAALFNISSAKEMNVARFVGSTGAAGTAAKWFKKAGRLHKLRNVAIIAGAAAGGALIDAGARLMGKKPGKESTPEGVSIPASFALASTIAGTAYYLRLNPVKGLAGLKSAIALARKRRTLQYTLKGIR